MPSRLIDYENLWTSGKLARLPREEDREAYLWIFGMADGHEGVFEADPLLVWQKTCAYMRPSHTPATIGRLLDELEKVKLLFRWQWHGKSLGHWVGITKPGRLPPPSKMKRSPRKYPTPPGELLEAFLAEDSAADDSSLFTPRSVEVEGFAASLTSASASAEGGYPVGTQVEADGYREGARGDLEVGVGLRRGKGVGVGRGHGAALPGAQNKVSAPAPLSSSPSFSSPSAPRPPAPPPSARGQSGVEHPQKRNTPFFSDADSGRIRREMVSEEKTRLCRYSSKNQLTSEEEEELIREFASCSMETLQVYVGTLNCAFVKLPQKGRPSFFEYVRTHLKMWVR